MIFLFKGFQCLIYQRGFAHPPEAAYQISSTGAGRVIDKASYSFDQVFASKKSFVKFLDRFMRKAVAKKLQDDLFSFEGVAV